MPIRRRPRSGAIAQDTEWHHFANELNANRYSPLDQINGTNFNNLQIAWRLDAAHFGPRMEDNWESTPLLVKGRLYVTAGARRDVVCLDAVTGEMIWMHREDEGERGADRAAHSFRPWLLLLDRRQESNASSMSRRAIA